MKVLLDTNIILDFALGRKPFSEDSEKIFRILFENKALGFFLASSITDLYYFLAKSKDHRSASEFIQQLVHFLEIIPVDKPLIQSALNQDWKDFEDALQYQGAVSHGVSLIITRNTKDFHSAIIPVLSPTQFLAQMGQQMGTD